MRDACDKGLERQLILSSDIARRTLLSRYGGTRLLHRVPRFRADAEERGIPAATIETMLRDNPARMLTFAKLTGGRKRLTAAAGLAGSFGEEQEPRWPARQVQDIAHLATCAGRARSLRSRARWRCCIGRIRRAQDSRVAEIATYQGADRAQRLIEGAKREGTLTFYSNAPTEDNTALVGAFEKKYGDQGQSLSRELGGNPPARRSTKRAPGASTSISSSTTRPPWRR